MLKKWYIKRQFSRFPAERSFEVPSSEQAIALAHVRRIIFTTTEFFYSGLPLVRQFFAVEDQTMATKERVLQLAASLANSSKRPVLRAISQAAVEAGQPIREVEVDAISPRGVTAKLDRTWYVLGDEDAMQVEGIELGMSIQTLIRQFEREGKYTIFLAQRNPKRLLGIFACEYPIIPEGAELVKEWEKLGLEIVLLSEAKTAFARSVGKQLGISLVHSELTPIEKQGIINDLATQTPASAILVKPRSNLKAPLRIIYGEKNGKSISIEDLEGLSEAIKAARELVKKVHKRIFWSRL